MADYGIATAAGLDSLTQTGTVLGTAGYLAPEQAEGRPATAASDRYALGVLAFELLTGSRPFQSDSLASEATAHVYAPVPAASERAGDVPREVDAVFRRALAKDPERRFSSSGELVDALRHAYDRSDGTTCVMPSARRSRWPALLAFLALLAIGGGIAAAVLATYGGAKQAAVVHTVTARGATVHEIVTAAPPATSGASLALQGYEKLKSGDAGGALPLLQQAARQLDGTNSTAEAYNDYNLAVALAKTSGCSRQVTDLLERSQRIQGHRSEIDQLRKACKKSR